jgi:hypothetical protein
MVLRCVVRGAVLHGMGIAQPTPSLMAINKSPPHVVTLRQQHFLHLFVTPEVILGRHATAAALKRANTTRH